MNIVRTDEEIDAELDTLAKAWAASSSNCSNLAFEQGAIFMVQWLRDPTAQSPSQILEEFMP